MTIRLRTLFFTGVILLIAWFFYIERNILTPFILGAILAYVLNPAVGFISEKVKLNRTLIALIIYLILVGLIIFLGTVAARQILQESNGIRNFSSNLIPNIQTQIKQLPDWLRPEANDLLMAFQRSRFFNSSSLITFFPKALSGFFGFLIFLISGFYFLKDGGKMFDKFLLAIPKEYKLDAEILFKKINSSFGDYLRGQILMIAFVSSVLFIALTIMGVRFALVLAIFSGFAEIVPIIGPILAGSVAALTVLLNGQVNFGLTPFMGAVAVAVIYTVLRQIQDYLVMPQVMGRMAKLHPLLILFAAIAGEHIAGILGLVLAVPVTAMLRIILGFFLDKINERSYAAKSS